MYSKLQDTSNHTSATIWELCPGNTKDLIYINIGLIKINDVMNIHGLLQLQKFRKATYNSIYFSAFKTQLFDNLQTFKADCQTFCTEYYEEGPMKPSLSKHIATGKYKYLGARCY